MELHERMARLEGIVARWGIRVARLERAQGGEGPVVEINQALAKYSHPAEPERTCRTCGNMSCYGKTGQMGVDTCSLWEPETPQEAAVAPPEAADGDKGERTCANCITESYCSLRARAAGKGCSFWGATTSREDAPESAQPPAALVGRGKDAERATGGHRGASATDVEAGHDGR